MNHTTNYNLNQWEAGDRVTRDDFNADNAAIDAALKTIADSAGGGIRFASGTYTGSGAERTISLGFQPKAVLLFTCQGATQDSAYTAGGLFFAGAPLRCSNQSKIAAEITTNGFTVYGNAVTGNHANISGIIYYYLAIKW